MPLSSAAITISNPLISVECGLAASNRSTLFRLANEIAPTCSARRSLGASWCVSVKNSGPPSRINCVRFAVVSAITRQLRFVHVRSALNCNGIFAAAVPSARTRTSDVHVRDDGLRVGSWHVIQNRSPAPTPHAIGGGIARRLTDRELHRPNRCRYAMMCKLGADAISTRAFAHRDPIGAAHQNLHASVVVSVANGPASVAL